MNMDFTQFTAREVFLLVWGLVVFVLLLFSIRRVQNLCQLLRQRKDTHHPPPIKRDKVQE